MSTAEMLAFKEEVFKTGLQTGVSADKVTDLAHAAAQSSNNIKFARQELGFMSKVMQASGGTAEEVGEGLGELQKKTGLTGKAFEDMVGRIYSFSKSSGREMTFKQILPQVGQLAKYARAIYGNKATTAQISDFITTAIFTGSPRAVMMAYKRMFTGKGLQYIRALGLKGIPTVQEVMARIQEKFPTRAGQLEALTKIFGRGSLEMEKLINDQAEYNRLVKESDAGRLFTDANMQAQSFGSAMNRLNTVFLKLADSALAPVIKQIADNLSKMDPSDINTIATAFEQLGNILGKVTLNLATILQDLTQGLDLFGQYSKIVEENERKKKDIEEKAAYDKMLRTGVVPTVASPAGSTAVPGKTPQDLGTFKGTSAEAQLLASRMFGGTPGTPTTQAEAQARGNEMFIGNLGGINMDQKIYLNGVEVPAKIETRSKIGHNSVIGKG